MGGGGSGPEGGRDVEILAVSYPGLKILSEAIQFCASDLADTDPSSPIRSPTCPVPALDIARA